MKNWAVSLWCIVLAACAAAPVQRAPDALFNDQLFRPASERISAADVFALSDEMRLYLDQQMSQRLRIGGARKGLVDAVSKRGELKLEYDSTMTRNAAQTFAARSGNCLSLVLMTAAFAKALELPVRYQSVLAGESVSRSGDIQYFIGHVNLTLGEKLIDLGPGRSVNDLMTIDFLSPAEVRGLSTTAIGEDVVVAMYMNNRAAEALAGGQVDDAYWWVRAAIVQAPQFVSAYNTLGIVYKRHGNLAEAELAYATALAREPRNTHVMANLVRLLEQKGRMAEAKVMAGQLAKLEPNPAFSYFDRGMAALREGNAEAAKDLFALEVNRAPYYHEFHFWLGIAYLQLGDHLRARRQFALAAENATTRREHDLYAAKLDRLKAGGIQ